MKVAVTGGSGFIGSHIVDKVLAEGHEVVIIDNLSSGNLKNIEHLRDNLKVQFIQMDICETNNLISALQGVEWIFHMAALADIVPSIQMPQTYHHSNVNGTISVLEAARNVGVKRIIYAASSSCYGIPDNFPTSEMAEIRCQYPYAVTKFLGEQYAMYWSKIYNLNITSMRFFNVYGTRSRTTGTYGAVFGVFLAQKLNGKPFTVVGTGEQTRDFTYVTDVADACYTAAKRNDINGEIFNVGSGNTYSVNKLVQLLGGEVLHIPKRPGEPDCTFADTSKIRRILNWEAKISLEEGVKTMLDNIEYWREAPVWEPNNIAEATKDWFKYLK